MPGRTEQAAGRRRVSDRAAVRLAVYHASPDVEKHVARLRRAQRFAVSCVPQRLARQWSSGSGLDGVLWELEPGRKPNWRRLACLAPGAPVVSYSEDGDRNLVDLSRAIGFASHLRAPLRPHEVEREVTAGVRADLAARLRAGHRRLPRLLGQPATQLDLMRGALASLEPEPIAEILLQRAAEWGLAPVWTVVVPGEPGASRILGARGLPLEASAQVVGAWVLRHGQDYAAAHVGLDRRLPDTAPVAALGFPLVSRGRTVGALVGLDWGPAAREPRLEAGLSNALRAFLEPAALALGAALRLERAEALSVTDDLTQLHNSRYLSEVLRRETKRATRSGRPLSLLFVDLDGFKSINDRHGHLYGSRALVEAADVIRRSARETDVAARFGGDEFALVLPDTGSDGAVSVGERVRERIAAHPFLAGEGLAVRLTASVGIATLPDVTGTVEGLIEAADQAMYRVKARGKNGIHVAAR